MADDLSAQVADLRVELEKRFGEIMNECTKLDGGLQTLDHRVSVVEETGDEGTARILQAIEESRGEPVARLNGRVKSTGLVAAGGGLGAGVLKLIEWLGG